MNTAAPAAGSRYRWWLLAALAAAAVLFYREFIHDIEAVAAVEYFQQQPRLDDADNAAYAFAGLVAPASSRNPHSWGYIEVVKNRERLLRGEARIRIVGEQQADDGRLALRLPAAGQHFTCWLPTKDKANTIPGCLDRTEMQALLAQNAIPLARYRELFDYAGLYFRQQDDIGFDHAPYLSRLLAIDLWMRRENLGATDIDTLFGFFRFWEGRARDSRLGLVGSTIAIANYDIAASLLARLTELEPGLLAIYHSRHGDFIEAGLDAGDYDRLVRAEFRSLNYEFCFFTRLGGEAVPCEQTGSNLYYKAGRTLDLLYRQRLTPGDCRDSTRRLGADPEAVDREFWKHAFRRPGNFRGRSSARLLSGAMRKACVLLDGVDRLAQQNRMRNLYLRFRRNAYTAAQIERHLAASGGQTDGEPVVTWDSEARTLRWLATDGRQRYELRYPE